MLCFLRTSFLGINKKSEHCDCIFIKKNLNFFKKICDFDEILEIILIKSKSNRKFLNINFYII